MVVVVVAAPVGDDGLGFEEVGELLKGKAFVARSRVEWSDPCVLFRVISSRCSACSRVTWCAGRRAHGR